MTNLNFTEAEKKEVGLDELVEYASRELLIEKRKDASNLIKNFLLKAEQLIMDVKIAERELAKKIVARDVTLEKIEKLKKGDWSILVQNGGVTKVDSTKPIQPE